MEIIKAFKKIIKELFKEEEKLIKHETVKVSEIDNWIKNKEKEVSSIKKELKILLKKNILEFILELNEKMALLEDVSLEDVKENQRTKHIVELNFNEYTNHLENLLSRLEDYENLDFDELNILISNSFNEFNKKSHLNYQKATYLIGKELGDVNECIKKFLINYSKIIKKNENILKKPLLIYKLKSDLKEKDDLAKTLKEMNKEAKTISLTINDLRKKIDDKEKDIEKLKQSKSYSENLKRIQKQNEVDSHILKEVTVLKQMIDFKYLFSIFRHNNKELDKIKRLKENFYDNFKSDNGKTLLIFLVEAKIKTDNLSKKIETINEKQKELAELKLEIKYDETKNHKDTIKNFEDEVEKNQVEFDRIVKRKAKVENEKESTQEKIADTLKNLNLTLI